VLTVLAGIVAIGVAVAWSHGEIAHTSLHTVARAPATLPAQAPSRDLHEAWRTPDRAAIGSPQWDGTVVTFGAHAVAGRDARTGRATWSYTRSDRTVCTAAQTGGTTIAVYAVHGNCDEVTALDSDTGRRRWTRTLDMDGMPVNGQPSYQVTSATFLVVTPDVIYAVDPVSGYNRWTYQRYGCRIEHAVLGSTGALISQDCSAQVRCNGVKFCGRGPQLFLRDGSAGRGDDNKPNADQIKWNRLGYLAVPVSADALVSAVDPAGQQLAALDARTGQPTRQTTLRPRSSRLGDVTAVPATNGELIWLSGTLYLIKSDATIGWSVPVPGPPTVVPASDGNPVSLDQVRVTALLPGEVMTLDGRNGRTVQHADVDAPADAVAYPLGSGFLVAGRTETVTYR
jgi:outer membrane protein assembly factor BamB